MGFCTSLKKLLLSPYHHLDPIISFFLLKPFIAIFTTLLDMSEDFSEEEDKAILRRNSKVKRKPRGMSNKMINEQKEQISSEGIKTTDSGDCPICGEVD